MIPFRLKSVLTAVITRRQYLLSTSYVSGSVLRPFPFHPHDGSVIVKLCDPRSHMRQLSRAWFQHHVLNHCFTSSQMLGGLKIYVQIPFLGFDWVGLGFVETQPLNSSKLHRWYAPNSNNQDISLLKRGSGGEAYIWKEMGRTRRFPELDSAFKALKCPVPVIHCWHSECVTWEAPNVDDPISNITWKSQPQCLVLSASLNMALDGESLRRASVPHP